MRPDSLVASRWLIDQFPIRHTDVWTRVLVLCAMSRLYRRRTGLLYRRRRTMCLDPTMHTDRRVDEAHRFIKGIFSTTLVIQNLKCDCMVS
jgi:hypothetical protein